MIIFFITGFISVFWGGNEEGVVILKAAAETPCCIKYFVCATLIEISSVGIS